MSRHQTLALLGAILAAIVSMAAHAAGEMVFSTAPTEDPATTRKLYTPLIDYLTQATGQKFVVAPAENFIEYGNNLRAGKYDLQFDGPHFAGWRMERMGAIPLARLPGTISIVVIVPNDSTVKEPLDLVSKRVCAFASPNLLTMDFLRYFTNPARQPILVREQGSKAVLDCLRDGRGEAAVLRSTIWAKLDQSGLKTLEEKYRSYPERTFTIGKNVDPALREKIAAALLSDEGQKALAPVLAVFKKDKLIAADPKDYDSLGDLLAPVWGFQ